LKYFEVSQPTEGELLGFMWHHIRSLASREFKGEIKAPLMQSQGFALTHPCVWLRVSQPLGILTPRGRVYRWCTRRTVKGPKKGNNLRL
jgi:hypothetical protein